MNDLWKKIRHAQIITVNHAALRMPYAPDVACWLDNNFLPEEGAALGELPCMKFTMRSGVYGDAQMLETTNKLEDFPACLEQNVQFTGKRTISGIFALSLAIWLQCKRIFLLGYDWNVGPDGVSDWFHDKDTKRAWLKNDAAPHDDIKDHDVFKGHAEIYNVSEISNIRSFPKISYEQFFKAVKT